jgi:hypothetical protein
MPRNILRSATRSTFHPEARIRPSAQQPGTRLSRRPLLALAVLLASSAACGHHSMAMFDGSRQLSLSGTVREFQWGSPHCYIQLLVSAGAPQPEEWSLEMGAPMYLYRLGWRPSTLKPGDKISITLRPLRDGTHGGLLLRATTVDGRQLGNGGSDRP